MTGRNSGYTLAPAGAGAEASAIYGFESVAGRLETVTAGSALGSTASSYIYEPARPHLIKTLTTPSHVVTNAWEPNRDVLDFKKNFQGTVNRSTYDYTVNPVGQRTAVATSGYAGGSWIWDYDTLGQVKKADNTTSTAYDRVYEYDTIGNRKKTADGTLTLPAADNWTANSLNQINTANSLAPSYDDAGNLISDAGANATGISRDYHWDAENRLIRVTPSIPGSDVATYRYDAWHRRISKTKGGLSTWFIYDGWNLIAEYTATTGSLPALKKVHHWGLDLSGTFQGAGGVGGLLATDLLDTSVAGLSGRYYPTYDGNGNVSEYLKTGGVAVARFTYDPFGRPLIATTSALALQLSFRFSTKYRDEETEFYYYGYRYFSTSLGRWINQDPIGERGGLNLYGMVKNNTINQRDVFGLVEFDEDYGSLEGIYDWVVGTTKYKRIPYAHFDQRGGVRDQILKEMAPQLYLQAVKLCNKMDSHSMKTENVTPVTKIGHSDIDWMNKTVIIGSSENMTAWKTWDEGCREQCLVQVTINITGSDGINFNPGQVFWKYFHDDWFLWIQNHSNIGHDYTLAGDGEPKHFEWKIELGTH